MNQKDRLEIALEVCHAIGRGERVGNQHYERLEPQLCPTCGHKSWYGSIGVCSYEELSNTEQI